MPDLALFDDLAEQVLVGEALVELLLGDAGLPRDLQQLLLGVAPRSGPGLLRLEQGVDHGVIAVVAGAAGEHEGCGGEIVERELAQHVTDLAGVDIFGLQLGEHFGLEIGAVRAGHRGVFNDGDGRVVLADDDVGQRARGHERGDVGVGLVLAGDVSALAEASTPVIDAKGDGDRQHEAEHDIEGPVGGGFLGRLGHWLPPLARFPLVSCSMASSLWQKREKRKPRLKVSASCRGCLPQAAQGPWPAPCRQNRRRRRAPRPQAAAWRPGLLALGRGAWRNRSWAMAR